MLFEPELNSKFFKRNKQRKLLDSGYFSDTEVTITWLSKIVIALFFTPVVAVTSLFAKNSIIALANIGLATGYLCNFMYRAFSGAISITDILLSLLGITVAITAAMLLTSGFFPVVISVGNIIFSSSVIATALNSFFSIKNVVIPTLKKILEFVLRIFGYELKSSLIVQKPLNIEDDKYVLYRLLMKNFKLNLYDSTLESAEEKIKVFNNMLAKIVEYMNKYTEEFLGNILNQSELSQLEKLKNELTLNGDDSNVAKFIRMKYDFKTIKKQELELAKKEVTEAITSADMVKYNTCILRYFNNIAPVTSDAQLTESATIASVVLDKAIAKQQAKIDSLADCIPEFVKGPQLV